MIINIVVTNYKEEKAVLKYLRDTTTKLSEYQLKIVIASASTVEAEYFDDIRKLKNVIDLKVVNVADSKLWTGQVLAGLSVLHNNLSFGVTIVCNTDQLIEIYNYGEFRNELNAVQNQFYGFLPDVRSSSGGKAYSCTQSWFRKEVIYGPCRFFIFFFTSEFFKTLKNLEHTAPHYCGDLLFTSRYRKMNKLHKTSALVVYSDLQNSSRFRKLSLIETYNDPKSIYNLRTLHFFNCERLKGTLIVFYPLLMMRMVIKGFLFWIHRRRK